MTNAKHCRDERTQARSVVDLAVQWSDGHRVRKGMIKDASANGLFLSPAWKPTDPIAPGDVITMRITGPGQSTELEAVVRWVGGSQQHACQGIGMSTRAETGLQDINNDDQNESIDSNSSHRPGT